MPSRAFLTGLFLTTSVPVLEGPTNTPWMPLDVTRLRRIVDPLAPEPTLALSQAQMMAADGRCKTFDAAANGFVRSEGCGIVVLKRLSDAVAPG